MMIPPAGCVVGTDDVPIPLESAKTDLAYDGSGNLAAVTLTWNGKQYVQTSTYDGSGNLSSISFWVLQ